MNQYINREKLKEMISITRMTKSDVAKKIGCSRSAFYYKLDGVTDFTESEIKELGKLFTTEIFFD